MTKISLIPIIKENNIIFAFHTHSVQSLKLAYVSQNTQQSFCKADALWQGISEGQYWLASDGKPKISGLNMVKTKFTLR